MYELTVLLISVDARGARHAVCRCDGFDDFEHVLNGFELVLDVHVVIQVDNCARFSAFGSGNESVSSLYDYEQPFERTQTTARIVRKGRSRSDRTVGADCCPTTGSDGVNLVVLHDKQISPAHTQSDEGGAVTFYLHGLPANGKGAVDDDSHTDPQKPPGD